MALKYLHTMVRVKDLDSSMAFYELLGLKEIRRREDDGGRYTLVFMAAPGQEDCPVELTYNWDGDEGLPSYSEVLRAPDVRLASWTPTEDPSAEGVEGRVAWSDALQSGYMLFEGLPENDPDEGQYQLWIFDATRDEAHPVDGGVFDVPPGEEVVVPIRAKLPVAEATLFAITVERPGGVVVSKRERLPLLAKVGG